MKCLVPQLAWWLDTSPLFSVDFQPKNDDKELRIATCGTDTHIRIWWLKLELEADGNKDKQIDIELRADLTRHQRTVNIVRFSNSGEILASGDDEANIILWRVLSSEAPQLFDSTENKENWQVHKILRGHVEDICDLQWSLRDSCLVSGSVDSTAIIWDAETGRSMSFLKERKGFIQGVAYDPRGQFVVTLSSDRQMYVYSTHTRKRVWVASKAEVVMGDGSKLSTRLFYDDTLKSFCRRPDFSPDGEFLIAPSGVIEKDGKLTNCVYIFHRSDFSKPIAYIPTATKFTTTVRFSKKFYKTRREPGSETVIKLPYRMIFAAATVDSIMVCDTETFTPFAMIADAHYARISDLTWSPDNSKLLASSTDGYCSFVFFEKCELGDLYTGDLPHLSAIDEIPKRKRKPKKEGAESNESPSGKKGDLDDEGDNEGDSDKMDSDEDEVNLDETQNSNDSGDEKSS
ncbi:chromatin assembly factor 1 subunit B [Galendromus occidentalis]|uniref:Chromatin assembly factor 1 subunit B n=1 Tax=Galendromus occidentalis TaxID=34638 RepID=A0AAJ6QUE5_9ACAR|nr:chromatin assembly factor 1 subunit B [Galendromus occidentalis]